MVLAPSIMCLWIGSEIPQLLFSIESNLNYKRYLLQTIYISFIIPLKKCGDIVWDNIPDYLKQFLESLQLETAPIVTGDTKLTSRQLLYYETGRETIQIHINYYKFIKFHKLFHKKSLKNPKIEEGQAIQWPTEKGQKDK